MNICSVVDRNTKKFQDILGDNAAAINAVAWANNNFDGASIDTKVDNALKFINKMKSASPKGETSANNFIKELHSKRLVEKVATDGGAHYRVNDHTKLVWHLISDKTSNIFAGYGNISDNFEAPKYNYIHAKKKIKIRANHAVRFDEGFKESVKSVGKGMLGYALMSLDGVVSTDRVNQSVAVIAERVAREVISGKEMSKADIDNIIDSMKDHFVKIRAVYENKGSVGGVAHMDSYLNNWDNFKSMVYNYLQKRSGMSLKAGVDQNKIKDSNIVDENEITDNNPDIDLDGGDKSQGNFSDNFSITLDSKTGLSGKLKLFLSTIKSGDKHYLTGEQLFKNFDEAYNTLSAILANTEPDIHLMINQLKDYADGSADLIWINNLIDKLNEAKATNPETGLPMNMSLIKQFVTAMNKHYIDMSFVQWVNNYAGTEMKVMGDNANSKERTIRAMWTQEIDLSGLVDIDVDGRRFYSKEHAKSALALFDELIATPTENKFFDAFNNIGIRLSKRTISELFKGNYKNGRYAFPVKNGIPVNIFSTTEASSPVANVYKILKTIADSNNLESTDNNTLDMMRQGSIQALSVLEAKYAKQLASNSHNSGNKTVYSYTNDKFIADRMYELVRAYKTGDKSHFKILEELQNDVFASNSRWLKQLSRAMKDNPSPEDLAFIDNFEFGYLSLNPIKKKDGKSDDRGLQDMSPQEIIAIKLGLFSNNSETVGKGLRVAKMFYPTMSDKTNMMLIKSILLNGITYDGTTVNSDTIDEVYESVVKAEMSRMNAVRTSTSDYRTSTGIDGYDNGSRLFYTIPELNALPQIFERTEGGVRVLKYEADLTQDDIDAIKIKIASSLNNMIREQIKEFADTKIGNVQGEPTLKFIDSKHIAYIKSLYPGVKMTNEQISNAVAADFAVNYFLNNVNIAQMLHGDYALYYTDKSKAIERLDDAYEVKAKDMSNKEIYDVVKSTFDNLGKRLAADLAPGYEADYGGDRTKLRVTTSHDRKMKSLAIDYIEEIFNATQSNQTKEDQDAIDAWMSTNSSDAQSWTSLEFHLDTLFNFGNKNVSEKDYYALKDKIAKAKKAGVDVEFSQDELKIILQPTKPVYVNNTQNSLSGDNTVGVRHYIKTSSFPLIPQLVRDSQLEGVMRAMDKGNIDLHVFESGYKVGSNNVHESKGNKIKNKINLFYTVEDKVPVEMLGDINPESLEILSNEKNIIELPIKGFKIQQEVPYHDHPGVVNKGTQESKLLFSNIRGIGGFKYNGETYDGNALEKIYIQKYKEIYKQQSDKLRNEIFTKGADGNPTSTVNIEAIQKILKEEAVSRNYSINDIIGLDINEFDKTFKYPIWALPAARQYESLLMSIVDNRVRKLKIPGNSFVLGSEAGFKYKGLEVFEKEGKATLKKYQDRIIFTSAFNGTSLQSYREEGGEMKGSQVFVPMKLKGANNEFVDIMKYTSVVGGKLMLDESRLPKELLNMFGFRIPTQGHNSMMKLEIAGFLPAEAGDLIIASQDLVTQMGSDKR